MMQYTGTLCAALGMGALVFPSGTTGEVQNSPEQVAMWREQHRRTVESLQVLESLDTRLDFKDPNTLESLLRFTEPAPTSDLVALEQELERLQAEKDGLETFLFDLGPSAAGSAHVPFPPIAAPTTGMRWRNSEPSPEGYSENGFVVDSTTGEAIDIHRSLNGKKASGANSQDFAEISIPMRFEDLQRERRRPVASLSEANLSEAGGNSANSTRSTSGSAPIAQPSSATAEDAFRQARAAYLAGNYESARQMLSTLAPTLDHLYWLGRAHEQLGQIDEALAAYDGASKQGTGELARRATEDADFLRWRRSLQDAVRQSEGLNEAQGSTQALEGTQEADGQQVTQP